MTLVRFLSETGELVPVSAANPLPVSGAGGLEASQISATSPATWDAETATIGVDGSSFASASHTHSIADVSGLQSALDGKAAASHAHTWSQISDRPVAAHVDPAAGTVEDVINALIAAGLMASA